MGNKNKYKFLIINSIIVSTFCFILAQHATSATNDKSELKNIISDSSITTTIKSKFLADDQIKSSDVSVETINGNVIITGSIPYEGLKERIRTIAKETEGVRSVELKVEVKPAVTTNSLISDAAITTAIKAKYIADADVKALDINVETVNGIVTLTGSVRNEAAKKKAIEIARKIDGVKEVRYTFNLPAAQ